MTAVQGALSAAERSMRSVFVGNIPYEATEEQLKDIFAEVGPVVSFRLVYDRETGKPKGYGFCEYKDQEMALSAMRNLNGYELNGRALRVDNAASEKSKEELKNLQAALGGPPVESPYGPDVPPELAAEAISKIMCSFPPEQLQDFVYEMQKSLESNPNESRTLLTQNPQLSYALLQAQVILKIIDIPTATTLLHPAPNIQTTSSNQVAFSTSSGQIVNSSSMQGVAINDISNFSSGMPMGLQQPPNPPMGMGPIAGNIQPSLLGDKPPIPPPPMAMFVPNQYQEKTQRQLLDHDLRQPQIIDRDMRAPMAPADKDMRHLPTIDQDFRGPPDPRMFRNMPGSGPTRQMVPDAMNATRPADMQPNRTSFDRPPAPPNMAPMRPQNPRMSGIPMIGASNSSSSMVAVGNSNSPMIGGNSPSVAASPRPSQSSIAATAAAIAPHDQEKAALIMQVLQLTESQIALLPPDQRNSILILKEQIARAQQS